MDKEIIINNRVTIYTIDENAIIKNTKTGNILEGWIGKRGYRVVSLRIDDKYPAVYIKKQIHRLVAEAFIPNSENKPFVNHKDGNKLNNNVNNLEWVTNKENYDHARKNGLIKTGDSLSYASVDNKTVEKICELITKGRSNIEIIIELGLPNDPHGKGLITRIRTGRAWKDISNNYDFIKTGSLKKVPDYLIHEICKLLEKNTPLKEIFEKLGSSNKMEYHRMKSLVYDIRTRKSHKNISKDYNF